MFDRAMRILSIIGLVAILSGSGAASAQPTPSAKPAQPAATPTARARATPSTSAGPSTSAAPAGSGAPTAAPTMPPQPRANPHDGGRPPEPTQRLNSAQNDPSLPPGTVVVEVRDADDRPIADVEVELDIVHNTVAAGETREKKKAKSDAQGIIRWEKLQFGTGHFYRVLTRYGEALFSLDAFGMKDVSGVRVVIYRFEVTSDLNVAKVGFQCFLGFAVKEDVLTVEQFINVYNFGEVAWLADVSIPLPEGFKAFTIPDEAADDLLKPVATETGVTLRGTMAPGKQGVVFRYQIPLNGEDSQSMEMTMFPRTVESRVVVQASKKMKVAVSGFPAAVPRKGDDGRAFLATQKMAMPNQGGVERFTVTLSGLPTRGPGGIIAGVLALLAIASGVAYLVTRNRTNEVGPELKDDLVEARETLLREIETLERAYRSKKIGPKTYERSRGMLIDALGRIVGEIERASGGPAVKTESPA